MLLAEKIIYLAINSSSNRIYSHLDQSTLRKALYAAILLELEFLRKVSITSYNLELLNTDRCERQILNEFLGEFASYGKKRSPKAWIEWFVEYLPDILYRLQMEMVNRNLLESKSIQSDFGAIAQDSFHITNEYQKSQLILHIKHIFEKEAKLSSYDRCLIGLSSCCGLIHVYLDFENNPQYQSIQEMIISALPILSIF